MKKTDKKGNTLIIAGVLLVLLLLSSFGWGFGMPMFFFGPVFMVLIVILIVWLTVNLIQNNRR